MSSVAIAGLTKTFVGAHGESIKALENASLSINDRELLVLVGPSSCGKTTLLRLIAGLEEPTAGTISVEGECINSVPPQDRDMAMVFQNYALYPHMSVYENLAFGLRLRKVPRGEVERRVREAAEWLELAAYLERMPKELSGGQRQRVALGRALVRQPRVLLLDEPLSNLDRQLRGQMRSKILQVHRELDTTTIYVTHDPVEAMSLGERIAVMRKGTIQQVAPPLELYRHPTNVFVAGFIGWPTMNLFHGQIVANGNGLFFQSRASSMPALGAESHAPPANGFCLKLPAETSGALRAGSEVLLGLRAEHIKVGQSGEQLGNSVKALAERVEHLGSEVHVHLSTAGEHFVARVGPQESLTLMETACCAFDMTQAHFFDPNTEKAVSVG